MAGIPTGTVTFLFTDIEGSTQRWDQGPEAMSAALKQHDAILRQAIEANGGYVFKTVGDAFCAAFPTTAAALQAALDAQHALHAEEWGASEPLKVRVALHVGAAEERDGDYFGPPVNRVARLLSAGHGGQVLLSDPAYDLVRDSLPTGVQVRDLGEHRLKDLYRPERIYQVTAPGLPQEFPPLKTLDNQPNNLPIQPTPLIGREREAAAAKKLLMRDDVRLLTLTGPGGTGKTRLALQVGADLLDSFKDGVWFVELAPLTDPNLVVSTIAQTLGVKEAAGQPLLETLSGYLQSKQILLILDNFEQIVEAAPHVGRLLAGSAGLKVVATSRVPLRVRGEHEYAVPPLELPDPKQLPPLERLTQYEAVRLFIERAQAVKTGFEIDNDNAPAVAEICARLDGLPLAIELAAARVRLLPPQAMLSRLESRLKLLTGGARDLPARQQTLRDTIEWSYDLLTDGEKQLFRRMAAFQGGRTLEALEAVCNANGDLQVDVLDGAESLVSKSLLQQREGRDGEPRFWMLETIHEYAREKLEESGEAGDIQREHALYFLAFAERVETQLRGPQQGYWQELLEAQHDNFRAALHWSTNSMSVEVALRLADALRGLWISAGHLGEGEDWLTKSLSRAPAGTPGPPAARARALETLAKVRWWRFEHTLQQAALEEALLLYNQLSDQHGKARVLHDLGNVAYRRHDYLLARSYYEKSLILHRELGDKRGTGHNMYGLARIFRNEGDYSSARKAYEERLAIERELGNKRNVGDVLNAIAYLVDDDEGRVAQAMWEEALQLISEAGDKPVLVDVLDSTALGAILVGDYSLARRRAKQALELAREVAITYAVPWNNHTLGLASLHEGDYREARSRFKESLEIWHKRRDVSGINWSLVAWAALANALGEPQRAARLLGSTDALAESREGTLGAVHLVPALRIQYERYVVATRKQLEEANWQAAYAEGRTMSTEQAIAYALDELEISDGDTPT